LIGEADLIRPRSPEESDRRDHTMSFAAVPLEAIVAIEADIQAEIVTAK
jgi:hypothetical protein